MNNWLAIWQNKGNRKAEKASLEELLSINGYDTKTSKLNSDDWLFYITKIIQKLNIEQNESVYEVGCGAGAFLYVMKRYCQKVSGLDYSKNLVEICKNACEIPSIDCKEAIDLDTNSKWDHVLSSGCFLYFPDEKYTFNVLDKMLLKSQKTIGIFDVNDLFKKEDFIKYKKETTVNYEKTYAGLEQLFLDKQFFFDWANKKGVKAIIEDQDIKNYNNSKYRYNVYVYL